MRKFVLIFLSSLLLTTSVHGEGLNNTDVGAMGAVIMDAKTGRVLWGKNEHAPLPMASTTKIMTAIIALENADLNDMVTISKRASAAPEVKMFLHTGEEIKLEYLLYALMLQSSNDAAIAIAEHVGGSVEGFCKMMTDKARALGAKDTVFETPNGLDSGNHHSTAYDMALIAKYALTNEKYMEIINTPSLYCNSSRREYSINNKNKLLREYQGANGMKTGFTGKAGHCFVGSAKRDGMQLITVVLASGWGDQGKAQKWKDTKKLLDYGFNNYEYHVIVEEGLAGGDIAIERSKTAKVSSHLVEGLTLPLNQEEKDSIRVEIEEPSLLRAPVEQGQIVGKAKVYIDQELCKEIDIITNQGAVRHDLKTSMEKVANSWLEMGTNETMEIVLPEF